MRQRSSRITISSKKEKHLIQRRTNDLNLVQDQSLEVEWDRNLDKWLKKNNIINIRKIST